MNDGLKPYPNVKDSGLRWFGDVPESWEHQALWSMSRMRNERNPGGLGLLSVFLDRGVIPYAEGGGQVHAPSLDLANYQVVRPGDFVLNNQQAWRGSVGVSRLEGIISPAYVVLRLSDRLLPAYSNFLVRSPAMVAQYVVASRGVGDIQRQLHMQSLRVVRVLLPPLEDQAAIVRFLDHADSRIRRYLGAKARLAKLLGEQKSLFVHRAVSGSEGDAAKLSTFEVPFLGRIPSHWPMVRAKNLFRQSALPVRGGDEIVTCFRDGQVTLRRNRRLTGFTNAILELGYQGIRAGQLMLHSMDAFAGAIGVSDSDGKCSPEYVICDPKSPGLLPEYYGHLLRSMALRGLFVMLCPSVRERAPRIRFSQFGGFRLPVPPLEEQVRIVELVKQRCRKLDDAAARTRKEIELLTEYRVRLIADVVTGKLDVREAAAKLPDETPDQESVDLEPEADGEEMDEGGAETELAEAEA